MTNMLIIAGPGCELYEIQDKKQMNRNYQFVHYKMEKYDQEVLNEKKQMVFLLLSEREKEISFNSNIFVEYPDKELFISNPTGFIEHLLSKTKMYNPSIVILTTYGDKLYDPLTSAGYHY